jgi:hypothetical protein
MIGWRLICVGGLTATIRLLSGCNTSGSLKDVEASCAASSASYKDAWSCVRQNLNYDEYRSRYMANGDALAAQIDAGQISDTAGRAIMASGFASMGGGGGRGRR